MDFTFAEGQRDLLDHFFRLQKHLPPLPACDDGFPCLDGRCPRCGSDMEAVLTKFRRKPEFQMDDWYRGALILEDASIKIGDGSMAPISAGNGLLRRLGSSLTRGGSLFIGTTGLVLEQARRRKVVAIEFSGTRRADADEQVASILKNYDGGVASLVPHGSIARQFGASAFLHENLLYGYIHRNPRVPAWPYCVESEELIGELAQNYGVHRITDRVITFGVGVLVNRLVQAPGSRDQLNLTDFGDLRD
ncbi:hypothetical protein J2X76_002235 [Neorhizobium sp. 2083]|uniref:hypothetical protein n=1 Tax=Neorhizobium sp. 2083 TaxID=2817762 RepID=UPI0013AF76EC|nr:hypothetical protein [Neorhizobium sp. 2083]MDR6817062.1 hypothetical protein [Neorhizobium sp. 2083]